VSLDPLGAALVELRDEPDQAVGVVGPEDTGLLGRPALQQSRGARALLQVKRLSAPARAPGLQSAGPPPAER